MRRSDSIPTNATLPSNTPAPLRQTIIRELRIFGLLHSFPSNRSNLSHTVEKPSRRLPLSKLSSVAKPISHSARPIRITRRGRPLSFVCHMRALKLWLLFRALRVRRNRINGYAPRCRCSEATPTLMGSAGYVQGVHRQSVLLL